MTLEILSVGGLGVSSWDKSYTD